jgi:type I restriction enzyme S subunit
MGSAGHNGFHEIALAKGPGIVIGRSGASFGQVHFSAHDYWPHNTALYVTDFLGNDPVYAFYFLKALDFSRYNSGSAQPSLNRNHIYPMQICVPPLDEQRAIARILGALDDKIELNRRMNETLEAMARALFKSWFVDFDPVRAKAEGHAPAGMDAATAALFPSRLVQSEQGEGPEGWKRGTISDLGRVITGGTPPTSSAESYGGHYPFVRVPDMHSRVWCSRTQLTLSRHGHETQATRLVPAMSVAVSCIATPGVVSLLKTPSHTNQQINTLVPDSDTSCFWAYFALGELRPEIVARASGGSVTPILSKSDFCRLALLIAPANVQKAFHQCISPLMVAMATNDDGSEALAATRDALLPRLLSGELRVPDAMRLIEAAP